MELAGHPAAQGRASAGRAWAARLDAAVGHATEVPAAILVAVEIVVLFAGVVSRYVFRAPLVWSDELASILFLWLAMLGSVIAFRRGEHMRMTALVNGAAPRLQAFLDVVAVAAALAFLLLILGPALDYAEDEMFIVTPALEIPNVWRAAALPVGSGLMILVALLRLLRSGRLADVLGAAALVGLLVLAPLVGGFLPASFQEAAGKYFPAQAGMAVFGVVPDPKALAPWTGYGILLAYVVGALVVGGFLLTRRDA
jgi:TRAP-type C4-dicarboxylate transport system permease small subunit